MKQHHMIEVFSANCHLCKEIIDIIEIGKCEGCKRIVYNINGMNNDVKAKINNYGIKVVPTTTIDGKIKIVGIPDFPWICGDDLYWKLELEYPLNKLQQSITRKFTQRLRRPVHEGSPI